MEYTGIKDLDNIINEYKIQLEIAEKYKKVLEELKTYNFDEYNWVKYNEDHGPYNSGFLSIISYGKCKAIHQGYFLGTDKFYYYVLDINNLENIFSNFDL